MSHRERKQKSDIKYVVQVKFLRDIYMDSLPDLITIMNAQADGDGKKIEEYLLEVKEFIDGLIEQTGIETNEKL